MDQDVKAFWAQQACSRISWIKTWDTVVRGDFSSGGATWFSGGKLNACYNCVDRHLPEKADQIALLWEGNEPSDYCKLSYAELYQSIGRLANALKEFGLKKGDKVCIYLPMIPEAVIAMLACARIGLIHSVVFAGFSAEALKTRILDSECVVVITADELFRGDKRIPLKHHVDEALMGCSKVRDVIVVRRGSGCVEWDSGRDRWYHEIIKEAQVDCPCEPMAADDPLFILYTSGSTGAPKGVLHTTAGYLVYVAATFHDYFHQHHAPVFWCTADIGWITGHSYSVYGPLLNGVTTVLFEGVPHHPTYTRYWDIIDKYGVTIFYTAPTALRAIRREGDHWLQQSSRKTLQLLGSVGEPINPEIARWYVDVVGAGRASMVDTWWQTETGGILIASGVPYSGIVATLLNDSGEEITAPYVSGQLVIQSPWPGLMKTIYRDHQRFLDAYLTVFPGYYFTGDGAYRDEQGLFHITGRSDDVIKVSGHRLGTEELESALVSYPGVSEAAVIGRSHPIKGEEIIAFVTLKAEMSPNHVLKLKLIEHVRQAIGPVATVSDIYWTPQLPKTRSGKIMRRLLKKIVSGEHESLGDLSTLADPSMIGTLVNMVGT